MVWRQDKIQAAQVAACQQLSPRTDQYPDTLEKASRILGNYHVGRPSPFGDQRGGMKQCLYSSRKGGVADKAVEQERKVAVRLIKIKEHKTQQLS